MTFKARYNDAESRGKSEAADVVNALKALEAQVGEVAAIYEELETVEEAQEQTVEAVKGHFKAVMRALHTHDQEVQRVLQVMKFMKGKVGEAKSGDIHKSVFAAFNDVVKKAEDLDAKGVRSGMDSVCGDLQKLLKTKYRIQMLSKDAETELTEMIAKLGAEDKPNTLIGKVNAL